MHRLGLLNQRQGFGIEILLVRLSEHFYIEIRVQRESLNNLLCSIIVLVALKKLFLIFARGDWLLVKVDVLASVIKLIPLRGFTAMG